MSTPIYIDHPNYRPRTEFPIPYVCSLSPLVRAAVQMVGADLAPHIESVVTDIEGNEEVVKSLKRPPPLPDGREYRQVDIRAGNNHILKCYVSWDQEKKWWLVFVEGPSETYFEKLWGKAFNRG